jgi:TolB-like protein
MRLACALALIAAATAARAATPTIAVSYFDNNTGDAALDPLQKGLADMLITDLAGIQAIRVVERDKLDRALAELALGKSKFIDPKTAQRLGRGLAAEYIMSGGYALAGGVLRIDARVFRVDTGEVVASERAEGKKEEFFALEKQLVDVLVDALHLQLGRDEKTRLRANPTQSFDAWSRYSAGLDAGDRGDAARARASYKQALAADPSYAAARTALERLDAVFALADRDVLAEADAEMKALDPKSRDFNQKVDALLTKLDWTNTEQSRRKTGLLLWLGRHGVLACARTAGPAPDSPHVLVDGVPAGGVISHCRQAHEVLLIAHELADDPSQSDTIAKVCERLIARLPQDKALLSFCKNTIVQDLRHLKDNPDEAEAHDAPRMKAMLAAYAAGP